MIIRRLSESDIESLLAIRREALLSEPTAFASSPEADVGLDPVVLREGMRQPSMQAKFGAFDGELVGTVGVHRYRREKEAHKADISGMYVRPTHRGRGLGTALLSAAIEFARSLEGVTHLHLSVSATAAPALRLYQRMGFVIWGTEEAALQVDGVLIDTHHMALRLMDAAA